MYSVWTKDIPILEDKEKFEKRLISSRWVLDHLTALLEQKELGLNRQEISPSVYNNPNWENRQAHANGYRQCLHNIKELINLDRKIIIQEGTNDPGNFNT